jgi:SpoU rRNA methylase family enzyme
MHEEFASVVHHDKQQDHRLDELARTASTLTGEVAAIRAMGKNFAKASASAPKSTVKLAANIVRIKELAQRAETLEAKVAALESRDRLARLLQREEASRARKAPVLALGEKPGITDGNM